MRHYKRVNTQGRTTTVESYSHDKKVVGAIKITKAEFDSYIASLPLIVPEPPRNLAAEIGLRNTESHVRRFNAGSSSNG